jgi:hypothetical protein
MEPGLGDKPEASPVSARAANDELPTRIDVYLSGGGYRAALGALGVMYFLAFDGRWDRVRRIISVSGGSVVNARLALARPDTPDVPTELTRLFRTLTSRRHSLRALVPAVAALFAVPVAAIAVSVWLLSDSLSVIALVAANLVLTLLCVMVGLYYALRMWLWLLYRGIVGKAYLDDLAGSDWMIEHVLVATDLSGHGSVFFVVNSIQPQVASVTRGYFDGRDVPFRKVLRASTALPPILPPTRLTLKSAPQRRNSPLAKREYLWDPEKNVWDPDTHEDIGDSVEMWLADGGVTGNLGIQLDSTIAPDNLALLEFTMAKTMRGPVHTRYMCRWHGDQITWNCCKCEQDTVVVDASGTSRAAPRLAERALGVPLLGLPVFALRSLQVMYGSSLSDDQGLAGDQLVGVVSTDQMIKRVVIKNRPLSRSDSSVDRMVRAGEFLSISQSLVSPDVRRKSLPRLMQGCYAARMASSELKTRLSAVSTPVAARVVASGYLNACLNVHGPEAIDTADKGIRRLATCLGPDAALQDWWDGVRAAMPAADPPLPWWAHPSE